MAVKAFRARTDVIPMLRDLRLNPDERMMFLVMLYHERLSICGLYEVPYNELADLTGVSDMRCAEVLQRLVAHRLVWYDYGLAFVPLICEVNSMAAYPANWPRALDNALNNFGRYRSQIGGRNQALMAFIAYHASHGRMSPDGQRIYVNADGERHPLPDWMTPVHNLGSYDGYFGTYDKVQYPTHHSAIPSQGIVKPPQGIGATPDTNAIPHTHSTHNTTPPIAIPSHGIASPDSQENQTFKSPDTDDNNTATPPQAPHPTTTTVSRGLLQKISNEEGGVGGGTNPQEQISHDPSAQHGRFSRLDGPPTSRKGTRHAKATLVAEAPPTAPEVLAAMMAYRAKWYPAAAAIPGVLHKSAIEMKNVGVATPRTDSTTPGANAAEATLPFPHMLTLDLTVEAARFVEHYTETSWCRSRGEPLTDWIQAAQRWLRQWNLYNKPNNVQGNGNGNGRAKTREERRAERTRRT